MPAEEYKIRSKDVQEVLTNPPKRSILWGNTIIIILFFAFLTGLSQYRIPTASHFSFQIVNSDVSMPSLGQKFKIKIYGNTPAQLKIDDTLKLQFDQNNLGHPILFYAGIAGLTQNGNEMIIKINSNKPNGFPEREYNQIRLGRGMFGVVSFNTGSISLLELFIHKTLNH